MWNTGWNCGEIAIAPFWSDLVLRPSQDASVSLKTNANGDSIVEFMNVGFSDPNYADCTVSFQVVLSSSATNRVIVAYKGMDRTVMDYVSPTPRCGFRVDNGLFANGRYEQLYVSDRLDTIITEAQKIAFYQDHKDLFELERPVLKVRYLQIAKNHPKRAYLVKKMASNKSSDLMEVDSLAFQCAVKYIDSSDEWLDAAQLASEFGLDVNKMMTLYKRPYITSDIASDPDLRVAYVVSVQTKGTAPVDFCDEKIRNYILSGRKRELLVGLERDLLKQALDNGKYEIY